VPAWREQVLTYEDCIRFNDLSDEEVEVLADHEHMPDMVACELATCLHTSQQGLKTLRRCMEEDLIVATRAHKRGRMVTIGRALSRFDQEHPGLA
jgi:hypothetical protein